jgi:hypothetical protein
MTAHNSQPTGRIGKLRNAPDSAVSILLIASWNAHASSGWSPAGLPSSW